MTERTIVRRNTILVALLVAGIFMVPFFSAPAFADRIPDQNPRKPGTGLVQVVELQSTTTAPFCGSAPPIDSSKGGLDVRFTVPSTITTIKNSGNPANAINFHIAFSGTDGNYYEAGMYYGSWTVAGGINYDPNNFQFAWGKGGQLIGVSTIPVVAGHDVEVSLVYLNSAGQWQAWVNDRTTGALQATNMGGNGANIQSDLFAVVESNTQGPNSNSQALGLVSVTSLFKATKVPGDGVNFSNWSHGYVAKNCSWQPNNADYGVTYLSSPGNFQIGYNGATKTNGAQLW
jgi:hypothetical protein